MDAHIIIDAEIGLTPAELAAAWNAGQNAANPARVTSAPPAAYDPSLLEIVVLTLTTIGGTLVASGVQQIVNSYTAQRPELPPAEVIELKRPDGSPLIVVRRKEQR